MRTKFIKSVVAGVTAIGLGATLAQAAAPSVPQGLITEKIFLNIGGGTAVTDLTGNAKYPNNPDITAYVPYFEAYATGDINTQPPSDVYSSSGVQIVGYFYPDETRDYTFYVCSDDNSALYLSTDQDPANKKLIARETAWSNQREYTTSGGSSTLADKDSSQFTGTQWPTKNASGGATISLVKGQAYYIEALEKEGGGGDNLSVSIDSLGPIPGNMLSAFARNTGPLTITTQPQDVTRNEGQSATFSVVEDGTPPYTYQWQRNGTAITDATNNSYTIPAVYYADNGAKFKVVVNGAVGSATSTEATLTVIKDVTAPTLVSAVGSIDFKQVTVTFSEPVTKASAEAVANYTIAGLTISAAAQSANPAVVVLTTSKQTEGAAYTLKVSNVQDMATTPNVIAANSTLDFHALSGVTGFAVMRIWDGSNPGIDNVMTTAQSRPADRTEVFPDAQTATWEDGDNYARLFEGIIVPPETGSYVFYISSDDQSRLWISTDDSAANLSTDPICEVTGWTNQREWTKEANQASAPVSLVKGTHYFFRAAQVEGGGGDGVAVGWELPSAAGTTVVIPGSALWTAVNIDNSSITISQQPQNFQATDGKDASFSIVATGKSDLGTTINYQWQKNGVNIAGETAATLNLVGVTAADNGTKYACVVSVPGKSVTSDQATLTVITDTVPPVILGAGAVKNQAGTFDVGIQFDEPLTESTAIATANYTLSAGTVSAINYMVSTPGVILTVSGLTAGSSYTVTVKDVADVKGNKMASTPVNFTVSGMTWGEVGADELGLGFPKGYGVVATGPDGFDLYSDGIAEWATYDEATFVYEQVTGDFDKKLRVEYQDGSSQWARAGLIMRDVTNVGVDRAAQEGGQAGRYQKIHVNPAGPTKTGPGTAGNPQWETNRRLNTGGAPDNVVANNADRIYPNAWCRLQRVGQELHYFRSDDGLTWVRLGISTWGVDSDGAGTQSQPLPAAVYVGPEFSPENGNITNPSDEGRWLASFRNYGNTFAAAPAVTKRDYSIGMKFGADYQGGGADPKPSSLAATDVAGIPGIKQKNWNNINGASGTQGNLVADKAGTATPTTATVTWTGNGLWSTHGDGELNNVMTGADFTLMHGYLDTGDATTSTITVDGVPADLTSGGYDLYVYTTGGVGAKGGGYRIVDADTGAVIRDYVYAYCTWDSPNYYPVPAGTSVTNYGTGNYIVFSGLKNTKFKIEATTANGLGKVYRGNAGAPRAPINAIQLVAPTTGQVITRPTMSLQKTAQGWTIVYDGVLYGADNASGPYTKVSGASSPYTLTPTGGAKFFRAGAQ